MLGITGEDDEHPANKSAIIVLNMIRRLARRRAYRVIL